MYYLAKAAQAAGLGMMVIGFVTNFPNLMGHEVFAFSLVFFMVGWIVEAALLKR